MNRERKKSQYTKCLLCKSEVKKFIKICDQCQKNPFKVEAYRDILAKQKKTADFTSSYEKAFAQIKNSNTGRFWDHKFSEPESLNQQDQMTIEKIKFIASKIPKDVKIKLLDIGIGQAYLEQVLKSTHNNLDIHGLDISSKAIKRAKANYKGAFLKGDLSEMSKKYKSNFFDVIVAIEVIEHISPTNIFNFYKSAHTLLKKNGIFIISTPLNENLENSNINPSAHLRQYTIPILRQEFAIARFKVIKIKTLIAFKSMYRVKNTVSKIIRKWEPNNIVIIAKKS